MAAEGTFSIAVEGEKDQGRIEKRNRKNLLTKIATSKLIMMHMANKPAAPIFRFISMLEAVMQDSRCGSGNISLSLNADSS